MSPAPEPDADLVRRLVRVLVLLAKRVKVQRRVVAPLEDQLELAVDVRGLVLTVGVGFQRVPLPYSLLLDGVDLRGNNMFGSRRRRDGASMASRWLRVAPRRRRRRASGPELSPVA